MSPMSPQSVPQYRPLLQKLRPFRFLIVVYASMFAVSIWENSHRDDAVDLMLSPHPNFTSTVFELYPGRAEPLYMRAIQAGLCAEKRYPVPVVCGEFNSWRIKDEVNDIFQLGLKTGVKHIEGIYYEYVQFLVVSGSTKSEIDAAYEKWRTNFPLSQLPDPRQVPL